MQSGMPKTTTNISPKLIRKYNVPGPRYTSYPTVPFWDESGISYHDWVASFQHSFSESNEKEGISIYVHLPFCENLCTFCGCHKRITKRHEVEKPYIDAVLKEWQIYCSYFAQRPNIKEIHLGGGTPTFFSSENLTRLIHGIMKDATRMENYEFSFEGHPNHTAEEQLQTLFDLGFRRCSFGVQDYDPVVQMTINRIQPFEHVRKVTEQAREIGFTSISHDLVFGLPKQNITTIMDTIEKTRQLKPDRISYYSYAHVPWIKGVGQRGFDESDLPDNEEKRALYEVGKKFFHEMGYIEIGMDHFALPTDSLYEAMKNKTLHRNFMGYTHGKTNVMIGLGMSSISDSWYAFAQNVKTVEEYQELVNEGTLPIFRGHKLSEEDLIIRKHILNVMCHFETSWSEKELNLEVFQHLSQHLSEMEKDGLVILGNNTLNVTEAGIPFVRNICMQLDAKLQRQEKGERVFSKTI